MAQGFARRVFATVAALCAGAALAAPGATAAPAAPQQPAIDGLTTAWRAPAGKAVTDEITVRPAGTAFQVQRRDGQRWRPVHEYTSDLTGAVTVGFPARLGVTTYRLVVPRTPALANALVSDSVEVIGFRKRATVSGWDTKESFVTKGTHVRDEVRGTPSGATAYVQRRACPGCEWRNVSKRTIPDDRRFMADLGKVRVGESKYRILVPSQTLVAKRAVSGSRVIVGYDKVPPVQLLPRDLNRLLSPLGIPAVSSPRVGDGNTARAVCAASELAGLGPSRRQPSDRFRALLFRTQRFRSAVPGMISGVNVSRSCQVAYFVSDGRVRRAVPVSTGRPGYPTDPGVFRIFRSVNGTETSNSFPEPHWNMYRSLYFNGGEALHGSYSDSYVRTYPDSHGCVRMLHRDVDWLWRKGWTVGTSVRVYGGW